MLLPAHAPEGVVGDRVPSKCGGELAFLGPGRTTWSSLTSLENLRTATEANPRRVSWEADLLGAGVLGGALESLELTSLASPKIDTYSSSSLSSGRKEASTGDVSGVNLCFLIPACHFKLVYIHYSSEKFPVRG